MRLPLLIENEYLIKNVMPDTTFAKLYEKAEVRRPPKVHPTAHVFGVDWQYSTGPERQNFYLKPGKTLKAGKEIVSMLRQDPDIRVQGIIMLSEEQAQDELAVGRETLDALHRAHQWYERLGTERIAYLKHEQGISEEDFERMKKGKFAPYWLQAKKAERIELEIKKIQKVVDELEAKAPKKSTPQTDQTPGLAEVTNSPLDLV